MKEKSQMRCSKARYAIHLDREGECPPGLRNRAIKHASSCVGCAEELRMVTASAESLARLREAVPTLSDPATLTLAIMRDVERPATAEIPSVAWPLSLLPSPRARFLLQAAAWAVALLFAGQSLLDANSMRTLEDRLARRTGPPDQGAGIAVPLAAAGPLGGIDLVSLLKDLRFPPATPPSELDRLRTRHPDLWTISLHDGLDARERQILLTQGPILLKEVEQLVKLGGRTNER